MQKDEILQVLRMEMPDLKQRFGVRSIGLFGSYAVNNNVPESDIDFLVELSAPLSKNYFGLWNFLENRFQKRIDLIRKGSHLSKAFIQHIEEQIIYA